MSINNIIFLNKKYILYSVCLMLFIDAMGGGLIFPILPELFIDNKFGLILTDTYLSREVLYSLSFALLPLFSIIGMPILGAMSDKYGRIQVILGGLIGLIINDLLSIASILTHNVWLFLFSIMLSGFLTGTYAVGNAIITDLSNNDEEIITNFKLPTLASMLGFILGPGLAIFVNKINIANPLIIPFIVACTLSVINFLLLWNNFRNINKSIKIKTFGYIANLNCTNSNKNNVLLNKLLLFRLMFNLITYVFTNQHTKVLAVSYLLCQFGFGLFLQSLSLNLAYNYHYTPSQIGEFFVIMAMSMAISMYLLHKLIAKFINYKTQIKIGLIAMSVLFVIYLVLHKVNVFQLHRIYITWTVTAIFYILIPFVTLGFTSLFAQNVPGRDKGQVMGGCGQIYSIGFFVSALLVGKLTVTTYNFILLISSISFILSYVILNNFLKCIDLSNKNQVAITR